ncbi:MAG: hypothetical protein IJ865_08775 [Clostridia bacterium]|nr:hypothetical protein [Clostridia bacterium]
MAETKELSDREIYRAYLDNTRKSEELQCEIMKGAREGEDPCSLLVKACRAISAMTGSEVFTQQVERSLRAVYGESLDVKIPLEMELKETEARLERIRKAEAETDESDLREAMHNAVRSHEAKVRQLREKLDKQAGESEGK